MHTNLEAEALSLHKKNSGKLETISKVSLLDRKDLSLAYTPGVAFVCDAIEKNPELAREYTLKKNTVAIVTDGSAVLGLGNIGALPSIPVMEGKAGILKEFAGVDAFPIALDTQDTEEIIKAIKQLSPVFGGINLEDIAAPKCFEIEERLRRELAIPVMHDDQWGAATVALAALINSCKLTGRHDRGSVRIVLSGVGAAGVATARLLSLARFSHITYIDSQGIITKDRPVLTKEKQELLSVSSVNPHEGDLASAVQGSDVFIGLSKPGVLTKTMVRTMNEQSIIFALANPTPEIMPEVAIAAGAYIVATGRSDYPNQINNSLLFPGFWRGMLDAQYERRYMGINNQAFVVIAEKIADHVLEPSREKILPDMFDKGLVSLVADGLKEFDLK